MHGIGAWQRLREGEAPEDGWDHLQCSSCRMVTDQGVWVCPILVNELFLPAIPALRPWRGRG